VDVPSVAFKIDLLYAGCFTLVLSLIDLILESVGGGGCLLPNAKAGSLMVADLLTGSAGAYSASLTASPFEDFVLIVDLPLINF
jgi:hypothetical protein